MADQEQLEHELADVELAIAGAEGDEKAELEERRRELEEQLGPKVADALAPAVIPAETTDAPADFAPAGTELVIPPGATPIETFTVLDRHDEEQVIRELERRGVKALFYDFQQGGSRIVDLSIHGVLEAVHLMNMTGKVRIRVNPMSREIRQETVDGVQYVVATVYAEDAITGAGFFGTSREPTRMKLTEAKARKRREEGKPVGEDNTEFDPFAEAKALNKAQRNALKHLIPQTVRQAMIAHATGNEELRREIMVGAGALAEAELPPPLRDERAQALTARAEELFVEIRNADPRAMLPGQYHAKLSRAASSHEELEALVRALESQRDHVVGAAS